MALSPLIGAVVALSPAMRRHLRTGGGFALGAAVTSTCIGVGSTLLIAMSRYPLPEVDSWEATSGITIGLLTASAIYGTTKAWERRVVYVLCVTLVAPTLAPMVDDGGLVYLVGGLLVYAFLFLYNPPLRASEPDMPE